MTTCKCREVPNQLVMSRALFEDQLRMKLEQGRKESIEDILKLLEVHRALWFSQSLNIGSGAFWANKAATTQSLITEIRKRA